MSEYKNAVLDAFVSHALGDNLPRWPKAAYHVPEAERCATRDPSRMAHGTATATTYGFMGGLPPREPNWAGLFDAIGKTNLAYLCRKGQMDTVMMLILMEEAMIRESIS